MPPQWWLCVESALGLRPLHRHHRQLLELQCCHQICNPHWTAEAVVSDLGCEKINFSHIMSSFFSPCCSPAFPSSQWVYKHFTWVKQRQELGSSPGQWFLFCLWVGRTQIQPGMNELSLCFEQDTNMRVRWGEEGCNVLCWWYSVSFGGIWVLSLQPYGPCRHYIECSEMLMGLYVPKALGASGAGLQQTAILKTLICPWLSLMVWHCFMGLFGQESHPQHSPPGHQALWFAYHSPRGSDEQTDNWRLMVFWETAVRRVYFHVSTAWFVGLTRLVG